MSLRKSPRPVATSLVGRALGCRDVRCGGRSATTSFFRCRLTPLVNMPEVWLRPNRRALWLGMLLPGMLLGAGAWLLAVSLSAGLWFGWTLVAAVALLAGVAIGLQLLYWMWIPRLAYEDRHLLVYLDSAAPTRVPIEIVECFFLGQGASELPKLEGKEPETANVIVRLAESAKDWRHRDVRPTLGHWCEGYITLNGAWCEPIDGEALKRLNQRLVAAHRKQRELHSQHAAGGTA